MGRKTDGSDWRIAVKDPADTESYLGVVSAADKFVVTSGVYERYFEENGVRYHHILDPKPGCRFAARCAYATEECSCQTPELEEVLPKHYVACHHVRAINGLK